MGKLSRVLASNNHSCPFRCIYCFAKGKEYKRISKKLDTLDRAFQVTADVLYPSCDSEYLLNHDVGVKLKSLIQGSDRDTIISISSKAACSPRTLDEFAELNQYLQEEGRGFIKISVSVTTKYSIAKIEGGACSYQQRIQMAKEISSRGLPSSINIKPILPSIGTAEYSEIISDFSHFKIPFLLGPLYLDPSTRWSAEVIDRYSDNIKLNRVDWLPGRPNWLAYDNPQKTKTIESEILEKGNLAFHCDLDVLEYMIEGRQELND